MQTAFIIKNKEAFFFSKEHSTIPSIRQGMAFIASLTMIKYDLTEERESRLFARTDSA